MARKPQPRQPVKLITPRDRSQASRILTPQPVTPEKPDSIALSAEHAQTARMQVLLIQHHQQIIASLERQLVAVMQAEYGVDVSGPETGWILNVGEGRLVRQGAETDNTEPSTPPGATKE